MKILFITYFHQKKVLEKIGRKFIRVRIWIRIRTFSKVGSGSGQKSSGSATLPIDVKEPGTNLIIRFLWYVLYRQIRLEVNEVSGLLIKIDIWRGYCIGTVYLSADVNPWTSTLALII
jgi:hypothetical protein